MLAPKMASAGWAAAASDQRSSQSGAGLASSSLNTRKSAPASRNTNSSAVFRAAFLPRRGSLRQCKGRRAA